MSEPKKIFIAAAIILDDDGNMLLVRKRNTEFFMQPGGKIEPTEAPEMALIRELNEELQIDVLVEDLVSLGQFTDIAANEPDHIIVAEMFSIKKVQGDILPAAEIEEVAWFSPADSHLNLAPLTRNKIVPLLSCPGAISG